MADIFISYRRQKRDRVRLIAESLNKSGLTVFWDARLKATASYIQQLNAELRGASCVVVAWCPDALHSPRGHVTGVV
jgi:TIR domain